MHLAGTPGLALEPVVQRALGNVEQPGRLGLGVHLALEQRHDSHRRANLALPSEVALASGPGPPRRVHEGPKGAWFKIAWAVCGP